MVQQAPASERIGFTVPMGWFCVGFSEEFEVGTVHARRYVERDLAVWRDAEGVLHVWDAYCPHLGAHLAVGGTVEGDCIVCPFHSWKFDASGANVEIPYADKPNKKATVHAYPVDERDGIALFWYHPDPAQAPIWTVPELDLPHGQPMSDRYEWTVETAWQEIAENAFDVAHFVSVHGLEQLGNLGELELNWPFRTSKIVNRYNTANGPYEGWQTTNSYGPGLGVTRFHIFGDAYLLALSTPIERDRTHSRFCWYYADDAVSQKTGPRFAAEVKRQFEQDKPIWEHKRFLPGPALAPIEKPITQFRKWAARFYAD